MIRIVETPQKWMPKNSNTFPPHQGGNPLIEERAFNYFCTQDIESDYIYIPVQWTTYHCNNRYGKDLEKISELQKWCNELTSTYPNEKFFTVVQYDDGPLVSIDNSKIFSCTSCGKSPKSKTSEYIPVPFLCQPHPGIPSENKKYKVGFVGRDDTHELRKVVFEKLKGIPDYKFLINIADKGVSDISTPMREVGFDSIFGLCPRGYGGGHGFRLFETIQMGAIPIYVSDQFWKPFSDVIDWDKLAVFVKDDEIDSIPKLVDDLIESGEYKNYQEYGKMVYDKYLTWEGTLNQISKTISKK